jgi:hypothetical protein
MDTRFPEIRAGTPRDIDHGRVNARRRSNARYRDATSTVVGPARKPGGSQVLSGWAIARSTACRNSPGW